MEKSPNLVTVTITGISQDYVKGKQKTFFVIKVEKDGYDWEVQRRYSDFDELHKQLKFHFSNLPSMPGKSIFTLKKPEDIEKRRNKLEIFLRLSVQREEFYANLKFSEFLELDKHAEDTLLNQPKLVGRLTHKHFGYRDMIMIEEKDIVFTLTSQMKATSRYGFIFLEIKTIFFLEIYFFFRN